MARGGQLKPTVRKYDVGVDITPERYELAIQAIADWFKVSRTTKEPKASAKYYLDCCLKGIKPTDGKSPWDSMALSTLNSRVRSACTFDLDTLTPLTSASRSTKAKKLQNKLTAQSKLRQAHVDDSMPREYRQTIDDGEPVYGDDPLVFFTSRELERREKLEAGYLHDFPQLRTVASMSKLDMLLDLTLLMERLRFRQAKDEAARATELQLQSLTKQIVELEKALNIHPDQLAKQQKDKEGGTIGDAVRRYEEANADELRERWSLEEFILLYQMYHTPSPRTNMDGYQMNDVALFSATRCMTCACASCGTRNYAGLKIDDIEQYLLTKGAIEPVEDDDAGTASMVASS